MVRKRQSREPLFYIQQPNIRKPEAPMQENYSTPKRIKKEPPRQDEGSPSFSMPARGNNFQHFQNPQPVSESEQVHDDISEQIQDEEAEHHQDDVSDTDEANSRPAFKDMTISEKIDYFVHMPSNIPRLKCEVTTEDRTYRGMIIDCEEKEEGEVIIMRTGRRTFTIATETITAIRLLGL